MPDAPEGQPNDSNVGPTDVHHNWMTNTLGLDPRVYMSSVAGTIGAIGMAARTLAAPLAGDAALAAAGTVAGVGIGAVVVAGAIIGAAKAIDHAKDLQDQPDPDDVYPIAGAPPQEQSEGGAPKTKDGRDDDDDDDDVRHIEEEVAIAVSENANASCDDIKDAIEKLIEELIQRKNDLKKHKGGDKGHQDRLAKMQKVMEILLAMAESKGCENIDDELKEEGRKVAS